MDSASVPSADLGSGMTSDATGVDPQKAAFVEAVAWTLGTGDVPLAVSHSGYGEDGYVEGASDLDPVDRYQVALAAWYRHAGVPVPGTHLLVAEASAWYSRRWGAAAAREVAAGDEVLQAVLALRDRLAAHGWDADTANDPDFYRGDDGLRARMRPETGQCAVTALVVQDLFGGDLLRVEMPAGSIRTFTSTPAGAGGHYFNRLPDGRVIDLTRDQFDSFEPVGPVEVRTREYLLSNEGTAARYALLRGRVDRGRHVPERLAALNPPSRQASIPPRRTGRLGPAQDWS